MLAGVAEAAGFSKPVPLSDTVCVEPADESVIVTAAVRTPPALGANTTEMLQLEFMAKLAWHVVLMPKSFAFVPVNWIPVIANAALPEFDKETICDAETARTEMLPKFKLLNDKEAAGTPIPTPASATVCGRFDADPVRVRAATRLPGADGKKVTEIVHPAPGAIAAEQPLLAEKSDGFAPAIEMADTERFPFPVFVTSRF